MKNLEFIRAGLPVNLLVAQHIDEILPKLQDAARAVPVAEKLMEAGTADKL
jgi:hypothetical protein